MTAAQRELIRGAGGGGSDSPNESPDSLRSTQIAELVDLLGEGEVGGLVNGLKSVYLDGVPIENPDGTRNFEGVEFHLLLGEPSQTPVDGFSQVEQEVPVSVQVLKATPVSRTIVDVDVESVRVTMSFPSLSDTQDDGDIVGTSVTWAVEIQSNGGGFVERYRDTVTGKAINGYKKSVVIALRPGTPPWVVRVKRITDDSTSAYLQNQTWWESYTEIEALRMRYRHSAVALMRIDAKNFSRVPTRAFDMMGVADWLIPTNYDPYARTYTGTWDGTFKAGWTNNPAWVYYNLVMNKRYGLGNYVPNADKWALYELGQWCDEGLDDGRGGTEPRYQINAQIMVQAEALNLLQDIAAIFRGAVLYGGGQISAAWDAPGDPVAQYAPANVVDGVFNYADGSAKQKASVCTCWWNDQTQLGKRAPVTWQDDALVAKYGYREMKPISPIGVTSPGQALRHAKWALYSQEYEDQVVSFRVGSDGVAGRIGQVCQITDPSETGERLGGRIKEATTTQVTLDGPVDLLGGETYTLCVTQPDPVDPTGLIVEERPVTTGVGTQTVLTVFPAFSAAPAAETVWILSANTAKPTLWRYVSIEPVKPDDGGEGASDGHTKPEYEITCVAHEPGKWDLVEHGLVVNKRPVRRLPDGATAPINLSLTEVVSNDGQVFKSQLVIGWEPTAPGLSYLVAWRLNSGTWVNVPPTRSWSVDVELPALGLVEVQVRAQALTGDPSPPLEGSITAIGNVQAAAAVVGLNLVNTSKGVVATWNRPTDFDWTTTELRLDGANPDVAAYLADVSATTYNLGWPTTGTHTVWARNKRRGGPASGWVYAQISYTGPDQLLDALDGRLTEEQFEAGLQDRLDLIDGTGPGSVNQRIAQFSLVGVNMIPGSGFDIDSNNDGVADGWGTFVGGSGDVGRVEIRSLVAALNGGGKAQRLQISSATNSNDSALVTLQPYFAVSVGLTYTLSGWLRSNGPTSYLMVRCVNGSGAQVGDFATAAVPADQVARRLACTFVVPAGAVAAYVMARGITAVGHWLEADAAQLQTGEMAGPYMPNPADQAALSASVTTEIAARVAGDNALAASLTAVQAQVGANSAAITAEATARADADSAQASQINSVSARLAAKGSNMARNSSFELDAQGDGLANEWLPYANGAVGTVSNNIVAGRVTGKAQRCQASNLGTTSLDRVGVYQVHTVTQGAMAELTLSAYVRGTAGATGRWYADFYNGGTHLGAINQSGPLSGAWSRLSATFSSMATATHFYIYAWADSKSGGGAVDFEVDDVLIEPGAVLNEYSPGLGEAGSAYAAVTEERAARVAEDGQLAAMWSVKVDANGRWAGIVTRAGAEEATIDLLADVVRIGSTSFADQALFVVYTVPTVVNGITLPPGVYVRDLFFGTLSGERIIAGSIETEQLKVGAATVAAASAASVDNQAIPSGSEFWVIGPLAVVSLDVTGTPVTMNAVLDVRATINSLSVGQFEVKAQLLDQDNTVLDDTTLFFGAIRPNSSSSTKSLSARIALADRRTYAAGNRALSVKVWCYWYSDTHVAVQASGVMTVKAKVIMQENKV